MHKGSISLIPLNSRIVKIGDNLVEVFLESLDKNNIELKDNDIIVIAENVVATSEGNLVKLNSVRESKEAKDLAKKYDMDPGYVQVVLDEAEKVYGGVSGALLTLKNEMICANAGVDSSNVPKGYVSLHPKDAKKSAQVLRKKLEDKFKISLGVVISDSRVYPLRRGTVGFSIGVSGIDEVIDDRGKEDIFGKKMKITTKAFSDLLASSAQLLMGEADELVPFVIIRSIKIGKMKQNKLSISMELDKCLFMNTFLKYNH